MQSRIPTHISLWHGPSDWTFRAGDSVSSDFASEPLKGTTLEEAVIEMLWILKFGTADRKRILYNEAVLACLKKGAIGEGESDE